MEDKLSCNVEIHEEELDGGIVYVAECIELGVSDFGESVDEALKNLKNAIYLLLEEAPEKQVLLTQQKNAMVTRLYL